MASHTSATPAPGSAQWWKAREERALKRRRRQDGITVERALDAALAILDAEGLAALTMRRLADELDTGQASLYRHFASRDELVAELVDHFLGRLTDAPPPRLGWRDAAQWGANRFRKQLRTHPAMVPLLTAAQVLGPNSMRGRENGLRLLVKAGLSPEQAVSCYLAMFHFVVAEAEQDLRHQARTTGERRALKTLFASQDADRYPTVVACADALARHRGEDEFEFGLQALLDGIAELIDRHPTPR